MAIYETKSGLKSGRRSSVEMRGVLTQRLPFEPTQIIAKAACSNSSEGAWGALWEGRLGHALMTSVESTRSHGLSVSVLGHAGKLVAEHCFRLDSAQSRAQLLGILWDPLRASLRAEPRALAPAVTAVDGIPEATAPPYAPLGRAAAGPPLDSEPFHIPEASAPPLERDCPLDRGHTFEHDAPHAGRGACCLGC